MDTLNWLIVALSSILAVFNFVALVRGNLTLGRYSIPDRGTAGVSLVVSVVVMLHSLSRITPSDFDKAMDLYNAGNYTSAYPAFCDVDSASEQFQASRRYRILTLLGGIAAQLDTMKREPNPVMLPIRVKLTEMWFTILFSLDEAAEYADPILVSQLMVDHWVAHLSVYELLDKNRRMVYDFQALRKEIGSITISGYDNTARRDSFLLALAQLETRHFELLTTEKLHGLWSWVLPSDDHRMAGCLGEMGVDVNNKYIYFSMGCPGLNGFGRRYEIRSISWDNSNQATIDIFDHRTVTIRFEENIAITEMVLDKGYRLSNEYYEEYWDHRGVELLKNQAWARE